MKIVQLTPEDKAHFQKFYNQHNVVAFMEDGFCNRVVVKMKQGYKGWTPFGTARDCGDHYIIARYSRYDRVDKKTMEITRDVEDK